MFLKKKEITIGDENIILYELSALQRADYFDFLAKKEKETDGLEGAERDAKSMRSMVESQAWLVSRSRWHEDRDREIDDLYDEIAQTWSMDALSEAVRAISEISGMSSSEDDEDEAENGEPITLEK
ncbi:MULTISPECIES: phage tail assembly chaperone G [Providencia]|uniref:phage tail assembly chaperone G n=1 Tax=Providencia TaxID=586 RepID=UPI001B380B28|nr:MULTISPECIES: phage minor tail protein G [Providencia]MBQ0314304.1 phage minor tail protein G [Providencia rettgeri]MBQ0323869.1 phage minor tail protein G [Providencia rettgeri]MBQ0349503.1 phage minor tail protein G [Providencia rettgeri]